MLINLQNIGNRSFRKRANQIRITVFKDDHRSEQFQKQQKVSLSFLSSLIQQQKNNSKTTNGENFMITASNQLEQESEGKDFYRKKSTSRSSYDKWKRIKYLSQSSDKRLLTNLIGTDWVYQTNDNYLKKKQRKTKKKVGYVYQQKILGNFNDEQTQEKRKMMESYFDRYLANKKQKTSTTQPIQLGCVTTKAHDQIQVKPYSQINVYRLSNGKYRPESIAKYQNYQQMEIKPRNIYSSSLDSAFFRRNNKEIIKNFKWSKITNSEKFILNDCH